MPERIQRQRTKGWRMPEGAVYVGRPTKWGNPYRVKDALRYGGATTLQEARQKAVDVFRDVRQYYVYPFAEDIRRELRGKDLVCWCPLDEPCHADVLLEWANG